jgi:hypothetical protein
LPMPLDPPTTSAVFPEKSKLSANHSPRGWSYGEKGSSRQLA